MLDFNSVTTRTAAPPTKPVQMAYVRKMSEYDEEFYRIYDENGRALAIAPSREMAFLTIRQHDLIPADVH